MLSYRHGFHAGNHADVLKHFVLVELLGRLAAKDKPFWYIDTHAGAGLYRLDAGFAEKQREFEDGIGRLWLAETPPAALKTYLDLVRTLNSGTALRKYPGSPWIARALSRNQDRLWLFELHPADAESLEQHVAAHDRRVRVQRADGFAGMKALLPPAPRRALTLIDPSYELAEDYSKVVGALREALARFATGIVMIWYPMLRNRDADSLPERLRQVAGDRWLDVRLTVRPRTGDRPGLYGSGVFIANPPFGLADTLRSAMPELVELLGNDGNAGYALAFETP